MDSCASEPIHRPGLVQPYGGLLVLDGSFRVTHASCDAEAFVGRPADACLGAELAQLFAPTTAAAIGETFATFTASESVLLPDAVSLPHDPRPIDLTLSRRGDAYFVEMERAEQETAVGGSAAAATITATFAQLHRSAQRLVASTSSQMLCEVLCEEVKALFGHQRVLVYKFDPHWHGTVVAECTGPPFASYLGHKFPEGDIPRQARAIFLENCLRMIPDATAKMKDLVGPQRCAVDMTRLQVRAASGIHLEYMRNMQTHASFTLSLRVNDRLWGLVACHHATPRYVPAKLRNAAEVLVRLASSLLQQKQWEDGEALRQHFAQLHGKLDDQLQAHESLTQALCEGSTNVNAANDTGGGCAVHLGNVWRYLGAVPPPEACALVLAWLQQKTDHDVVYSDSLLAEIPALAPYCQQVSGVVAISLPQSDSSYVMWFRPELPRETVWAGNPHDHKQAVQSPSTDQTQLHPRKSFAQYREVTRGHSAAVRREEIDFAKALRKSIIEVDLARKVESERRLRKQAEEQRQCAQEAVALREHVLNIVSHDLRNPISAIELTSQLARRRAHRAQQPPALQDYQGILDKLDSATKRMRGLVEDILSLSKIQAGQLQLDRAEIKTDALLQEVYTLLEPAAEAQALNLKVEVPPDQVVCHGDAERLMQALGNLVSNAIKFTPQGGTITVSAAPTRQRDAVVFKVADTGKGVPAHDQERIFQTFWQAKGETAKAGLGLGLTIVKQIVEAHGGQVWVESKEGQGSTFAFTCPSEKIGRSSLQAH